MSKYSKLTESYNGCDEIGDIFQEKMVRMAYGRLWNLEYPDEKIQIQDFSIFNKQHLDFVRKVFSTEELADEFLLCLRLYGIRFGNISRFPYDASQITTFILIWNDIRGRVECYSESFGSIFSQKIFEVLDSVADIPVLENGDTEHTRLAGLKFLTMSSFSPINEFGEIIYGHSSAERYGYFIVITQDGEFQNVAPNGKILSEEQVENLLFEGISDDITTRVNCIKFLNREGNILSGIDHNFLEILCEENNFSTTEDRQQIIDHLNMEIESLNQKRKKHTKSTLTVVE